MSYNQVLNNHPQYRRELLAALVNGTPFPKFTVREGASAPTPVTKDPLLRLFQNRDFTDVDAIMRLQYKKFGPINEELFWSVIAYIGHHGSALSRELFVLFDTSRRRPTHVPSDAAFVEWRRFHREYFADVIAYVKAQTPAGINTYSNKQLQHIFNDVLETAGLAQKGWLAASDPHSNFVTVDKRSQRLYIGPERVRLSRLRLIGLLLHEIYIHALWAQHYHTKGTSDREEGVGTLVEQLTIRRYHPLRMYRFLAICFAAGVDGTPRTMREVFELLCNVREALSPMESAESRKLFVAKETIRVYRNLPPNKAGLVYIRDKNYLEHNEQIWGTLMNSEPSLMAYRALVAPWKDEV